MVRQPLKIVYEQGSAKGLEELKGVFWVQLFHFRKFFIHNPFYDIVTY